jgi:hypothetical protein
MSPIIEIVKRDRTNAIVDYGGLNRYFNEEPCKGNIGGTAENKPSSKIVYLDRALIMYRM